MKIRTYQQAIDYLSKFTNYEKQIRVPYSKSAYNLDTMLKLMHCVGNPHTKLKAIHVAGTKGKGSTCMMIESIIRRHGFRTGLYQSPHLIGLMERIQINGVNCPRQIFVKYMNELVPHMTKLRPTFFEIMTAISFLIFERLNLDYTVIEVGLGGRLDCTNIISPQVTVITSIDYDHQDKLGTKLSQIAFEKGGIIKHGVPCVIAPQRPSAARVLEKTGRNVGSRIIKVSPLCVSLPEHQKINASLAAAACKIALKDKFSSGIARSAIYKKLPGRQEIVSKKPLIVVDSAHNVASIRASIPIVKNKKFILVFGASSDKPVRKMLSLLLPFTAYLVLTRASSPRAYEPETIYGLVRKDIPVFIQNDVASAVDLAKRIVKNYDGILITGSFYVAGEALRCLRKS